MVDADTRRATVRIEFELDPAAFQCLPDGAEVICDWGSIAAFEIL